MTLGQAFTAPDIDYAGLSPIIALTGGLVLVLMVGLVGRAQRALVSAASFLAYGAAAGLAIWQMGEEKDLVAGALRLDDLGLVAMLISILCAAFVIPLELARGGGRPRPRPRRPWRVPGASDRVGPGHGAPRDGPEPGDLLRRSRASVGTPLRPVRLGAQAQGLARIRAQVPDRRKPRLGDAPLRPRVHLRRLGLDGLLGHPRRHRRRPGRRSADPDRHRSDGDGPRVQAFDRALPPVDA